MITNKNLILIIDILRKVFSPASVPFNRQAAARAFPFPPPQVEYNKPASELPVFANNTNGEVVIMMIINNVNLIKNIIDK